MGIVHYTCVDSLAPLLQEAHEDLKHRNIQSQLVQYVMPIHTGAVRSALATSVVLAAFLCACAQAEVLKGRVIGLADGDSITVLDATLTQHRVRVAGIDAPERRQPFASRSKAALNALLAGKQVHVEWGKKDRYQRLVGVVRVGRLMPGSNKSEPGWPGTTRPTSESKVHRTGVFTPRQKVKPVPHVEGCGLNQTRKHHGITGSSDAPLEEHRLARQQFRKAVLERPLNATHLDRGILV